MFRHADCYFDGVSEFGLQEVDWNKLAFLVSQMMTLHSKLQRQGKEKQSCISKTTRRSVAHREVDKRISTSSTSHSNQMSKHQISVVIARCFA